MTSVPHHIIPHNFIPNQMALRHLRNTIKSVRNCLSSNEPVIANVSYNATITSNLILIVGMTNYTYNEVANSGIYPNQIVLNSNYISTCSKSSKTILQQSQVVVYVDLASLLRTNKATNSNGSYTFTSRIPPRDFIMVKYR